MGDRLAGMPSRHRTRHPGLLRMSLPCVGMWNEYLGQAGEDDGSKQVYRMIH